jgi:tetratricopeptide (TPR) repeat protein
MAQREAEVTDTRIIREEEPLAHRTRGEIALAEKRPRDALAEFWKSDTLPDGPASTCLRCLYVRLARAWKDIGEVDSAIFYFERYAAQIDGGNLDMPTEALFYARSLLHLGELYEARGDADKAVTWYLKFVDTWKNADAPLQPQVADVRRRIARLSKAEKR